MGVRTVRTCDFCKEEIKGAWLEVTGEGDETATYQDVADLGYSPENPAMLFDSAECIARYFAPNIKEENER